MASIHKDVFVVYFDLHLGAANAKGCLKYAISIFHFKMQKGRKTTFCM